MNRTAKRTKEPEKVYSAAFKAFVAEYIAYEDRLTSEFLWSLFQVYEHGRMQGRKEVETETKKSYLFQIGKIFEIAAKNYECAEKGGDEVELAEARGRRLGINLCKRIIQE